MGRLFHFSKLTSIRYNFLYARQVFLKKKDIAEAQNLLERYKNNKSEFGKPIYNLVGKDKELWDAKYTVKATTNHETGKILPLPYRMYFFVPMNIPIAFGLFYLPATGFNIALFNWINQTYNASINYMNSSGSSDSTRLLAISYACALTSSIGTGLLLRRAFKPSPNPRLLTEILIRTLPSCMAGFLNLFCMRFDCILNGINIRDENGNIIGLSKVCGKKAVMEGALSRFVLPIPLILQFLIMRQLRKYSFSGGFLKFMELTLCGVALGVGLPFSIAIFKQIGRISTIGLEKEFQNLVDSNGKPIEYVYYNKGL